MSNPGSSKHSGTVRVLTLNLWAQNAAWVDRRSVLSKGLRELNPDLVAFLGLMDFIAHRGWIDNKTTAN